MRFLSPILPYSLFFGLTLLAFAEAKAELKDGLELKKKVSSINSEPESSEFPLGSYINAVFSKSEANSHRALLNVKDDDATTDEDTFVAIDVLANDVPAFFIDRSTVQLGQTTTAEGTYSVDGNGIVTFTPTANFNGTASNTYTVNDFFGQTSDPANITITVNAINDPPAITGQNPSPLSAIENQSFAVDISNVTVSDPDQGDSFTLNILDGTNYTHSGLTVTPAAGYSGALTVGVTVNDGTVDSAPFDLAVSVAAVNVPPQITGQNSVTTNEDNPITILLTDLQITDPDNTPADFHLIVSGGTNYTVSGNTITPALNYNGVLNVSVVVNDGHDNSDPFALQVTVNPVNDPPIINGQQSLVVNESTPITVLLTDLNVTDVDNSYPDNFTLTLAGGSNYTVAGSTITPTLNYNGDLTVPVFVNDGTDNSNTFQLHVTVTPVNNPPVITGQTPNPLVTNEDTPITITFANLAVTDVDNPYPSGFTIVPSSGSNYSVVGTTVTPSQNYNGDLVVPVVVNDGTSNSNTLQLHISVTPVNDAPQIAGQQTLATNEDTAITLTIANLIISDVDTNPINFVLSVMPGTNYVAVGTKITPASNFNGQITVPVKVSDGIASSSVFQVLITVNPINDPPVASQKAPIPFAVNEDNAYTILLSNFTITDIDNTPPTGFSLSVASGANYSVSGSTITPVKDYNGPLTVPVTINDGTSNSAPVDFKITVKPVNDPPIINGQNPLNTGENQAITLSVSQLSISDPDNTVFTLNIFSGVNYSVAGNVVTPQTDFSGVLNVKVTVFDGQAYSDPFNLQVQVNVVNKPPVITGQQTLTVNEDSPLLIDFASLIVTDPDNTYPTGFTLTVLPGTNYTFSGNTLAPVANFNGILTVNVKVNDGLIDSAPYKLQILVNPVNDAPVISAQQPLSTNEDTPIAILLSNVIVTDPDNSYPTGFTISVGAGTNYTVTGTTITPAANFSGKIAAPVTVNDGLVNSNVFSLQLTVVPVNDLPVFTSTPVTIAVVGEPYEYQIETSDVENDVLTLTATAKPAWATLTNISNGKAKLSGVPPVGSAGTTTVTLQVKDSGAPQTQTFTLTYDTKPALNPFAITEDEDVPVTFTLTQFTDPQTYKDAEGNPLAAIQIVTLPNHGKVKLNGTDVTITDEITASSLSALEYIPDANYNGLDTLYWRANDGVPNVYSNKTYINFVIQPVNDAPEITQIETDPLKYDIGDGPVRLTKEFVVIDVDDVNIVSAAINFNLDTYKETIDQLVYKDTLGIQGKFDGTTGTLLLKGVATPDSYTNAIRSIRYNLSSTDNVKLADKILSITLSDGKATSPARERQIQQIYTFIDLVIPNGFTPNGDGVNEEWVLSHVLGLKQFDKAELRVYSKGGTLVYQSIGLEKFWNGYYNGQLLPADSYFYTIDLNFEYLTKTYRGAVTILRP